MTEDLKLNVTSVENLNLQIEQRQRAEEALRQRVQEMTVLNTLAHRVSSSLLLDQVVQAALDGIVAGFGSELALLLTCEGEKMFLRGAEVTGVTPRIAFDGMLIELPAGSNQVIFGDLGR